MNLTFSHLPFDSTNDFFQSTGHTSPALNQKIICKIKLLCDKFAQHEISGLVNLVYSSLKILFIILILLFSSYVYGQNIRVAVASNFISTLKILAPTFEKQHNAKLLISSASTGKHYAQIVNGAPFDILLAADRSYVARLDNLGYVVSGSRFVYAQGQLVLWSRNNNRSLDRKSIDDTGIKWVAIANPKTAPYGLAAQQVLDKLGKWQAIKTILVKGENIGQAFQFVASGNAELGFVARSQVLNPANPFNKEKYWLISSDYYSPLEQEAALLKRGENNKSAEQFLKYLKSSEARNIIQQQGYL